MQSVRTNSDGASVGDAQAWDREADLVILGAGTAGMAAALIASIEGLDVLLCEASDQVGGTTATSAGTVWIPGNSQSRAAGHADSAEDGRTYLHALIGSNARDRLRDVYLEQGPAVIDYLRQHSQVRFVPSGMHPDYQDLPGAATSGRALAPETFDARVLGKNFAHVRPPIPEFMVLGGMMAGKADIPRLVGRFRSPANFMHSARLFLHYVGDRVRGFGRGTRLVMGNALVGRLYASLLDRKVPLLFEARLAEIVQHGGTTQGVVLQMPNRLLRVRAHKAVVLATGGFARDRALREAWMPHPTPLHSMAAPANLGDGVRLGCGAGGEVGGTPGSSGGFWTPASVTALRGAAWGGLYPHLSLDRAKPGLIAVNSAGRRFVNEAVSYHDFVLAMFESNKSTPTMPAYLVCEENFVRRYGLGNIHPGGADLGRHESDGYLSRAPTLDALARLIGVDAAGLQQTVERYNQHARLGQDPDFHKGSTTLNRFNGDPDIGPNPCLAPLERGPFCAVAVWPAEIACSTGLFTDEHARVLDRDGRPVPGLYACGNDMSSIMDGTYPGPGTTLGPALVFASQAVRQVLRTNATTTRGTEQNPDRRQDENTPQPHI